MSLKDLLVIVDNDPTCAARVDMALALAAEHEAHVTGLHVMPWPLAQIYSEVPIPETVEKLQRLELEEAARRAGALFAARAGRTTVPTEWRVAEGDVVRVAREHARYADLTLVPQGLEIGSASADLSTLPQELALSVGHPVLVIPRFGSSPRLGSQVLVAWNGSREATRGGRGRLAAPAAGRPGHRAHDRSGGSRARTSAVTSPVMGSTCRRRRSPAPTSPWATSCSRTPPTTTSTSS